ncbi:hypothetical protein [Chelatococcus asaccharovorans]|uniref:Uncharacterized protein n=1 Tax=Chelatococcus asaccharovorans TaxID=28210 RepID=A0A2V3U3C7_9HYPH|nr:hypothetical protein [Chelatococcus asaccharovorans]MBS7702697.1 hypothetical protein [Chelatococcus asaccharovorans]PXW56991.1 hypothetical protein C7450_10728 [Chelatococcus asaccharovorans]
MATYVHNTSLDRAAIMRAAWAIFREVYRFPAVPFASIGRKCFAWALREAWRRGREKARAALVKPEARKAEVIRLHREIEVLDFADTFTAADNRRREALRDQIDRLAA